jgi:adenylate cyclase class 2
MKSEIEVKFIDVDTDDIRRRLEAAGAELEHPMRLMKRALIEEPHHEKENSFIRIRDEGDKTTLAFKRRALPDGLTTIDSTKEIETTVGDFDTTVEIFAEAGWHYITLQESRRETWKLGEAEVVIDEWPWIKPYIEIEAETEVIVREATAKLGFDWNDAVFGSVDVIYDRDFPKMSVRGIIDVKDARFGDPVPDTFLG